jgi:hypothetical protein
LTRTVNHPKTPSVMSEPPEHVWRFTNRYGEAWEFTFNASKREGTLRGSDVNWKSYRVVGGQVAGVILNDEEIKWLRQAWSEATKT